MALVLERISKHVRSLTQIIVYKSHLIYCKTFIKDYDVTVTHRVENVHVMRYKGL